MIVPPLLWKFRWRNVCKWRGGIDGRSSCLGEVRRGGTRWTEGDTGAILEGEGEVRKGDTGVFVSWEEQRIEMYLGDSGAC